MGITRKTGSKEQQYKKEIKNGREGKEVIPSDFTPFCIMRRQIAGTQVKYASNIL